MWTIAILLEDEILYIKKKSGNFTGLLVLLQSAAHLFRQSS